MFPRLHINFTRNNHGIDDMAMAVIAMLEKREKYKKNKKKNKIKNEFSENYLFAWFYWICFGIKRLCIYLFANEHSVSIK